MSNKFKNWLAWCIVCVVFAHSATAPAFSQDLLNDNIGFSGASLHLKAYVDPGPDRRIISMTTQPANTGNSDLFVTTQDGAVYSVQDNGFGGTPTEWFNYNAAVSAAVPNANNGFVLENPAGAHGGLRSVAFHPEFATNGKFYTSAMVDRPSGVSGINYIGNSTSGFDGESAVAEWTYDFVNEQVDTSSYRELFRVQMPVFDHPVKQIAFNNFAEPGDEDYGLLYITHGDGSVQSAIAGGGLVTDDALGKVLRVNPLESGNDPYTTPGNPFNSTPGTLNEIYTLGHRNPHHISFAKDSGGTSHAIIAEGGRDNIEEVNLLQSGGSYGWSEREGTFIHNQSGGGYGLGNGVSSLPANEWQLNDYIYPAAQYDHDSNNGQGIVGSIIAGGFVIDNNTDAALQGEYIFADFGGKSGNVYQATFTDMLAAHTQLADGEAPSALTQAPISRLQLTLDSNGDGIIDNSADNLNSLFGTGRNDARFGRGPNGEMFISSKQTGLVYLVTNTTVQNQLTLNVDRTTGEVTITNGSGVDIDIDAINIQSVSGALAPNQFQTIGAGWTQSAANSNSSLSQVNENSILTFDEVTSAQLGDIYDPQLQGFGQQPPQDLLFTYTAPGQGTSTGAVVYTGVPSEPNTLVMTINLATGEATVTNPTAFSQEVEAYTISSESGSLNAAGWQTFESQGIDDGDWSAAIPALSTRLTELQEDGTTTFDNLTTYQLGQLFAGGAQDFVFEFLLAGDSSPLEGLVVFTLPGDFDADSDVDGDDFLAWQRGDSPNPLSASDLADWQANYGLSALTLQAATAVPEPSGLLLLLLASYFGFGGRLAPELIRRRA